MSAEHELVDAATGIRRVFEDLDSFGARPGAAGDMGMGSDDLRPGREYLARCFEHGLAVPSWPRAYGGRGASPSQVDEIRRLLVTEPIPDLYPFTIGLHMVGPALLDVGTDEQKNRWLPAIASGADIWCQLFSEPEAGSDLASLRTQAVAEGGDWRLTGQKVWVSRAMWARWGVVLARTGAQASRHHGLTVFAVDMQAPGVEVRPLRQMNHDEHFSEVFLDEVPIPDAHRIGEVDAGWKVAMGILANERRIAGELTRERGDLIPAWVSDLHNMGLLAEETVKHQVLEVVVEGVAAAVGSLDRFQTSSHRIDGLKNGPARLGSVGKLRKSSHFKSAADAQLAALGRAGLLVESPGYLRYLTAPSMSIRGGTDEIQKNILAERVMSLPREPRFEKE